VKLSVLKPSQPIRSRYASLVLFALVAWLANAQSALATVLNMQNLVAANGSLLHHYTFEGATVAQREEDKKGTLHLDPITYGSATASMIQYVTGFDATTTAVRTARPGGDLPTDNGGLGGAGLSSGTNYLSVPGTIPRLTAEMLVRPDQATLPGTNDGVGYVAMIREPTGVETTRGNFLYQGSATAANSSRFSAGAGNGFDAAHEQSIVNPLTPGHWYYYATVFEDVLTVGLTDTKITSYIADLTAGQTTLTSLGSITVDGIFTSGGGGTSPLGVGIGDMRRLDTGNPPATQSRPRSAFPGAIDSLALYGGVITQATLQSHLDALWLNNLPVENAIPEPSTFGLLLTALAVLKLRRRSKAN